MKKILTLCVVAMMAVSMSARTYKHSLGMVAGSGIGVQYKMMVMENFTIIDEFGYLGSLAAATSGGHTSLLGAVDNLVLAYQANIIESDGIRLDYYAGGQIKAGYVGTAGVYNAGVVGVGAAGGIEANMHNAPIAFSLDFRPGYGCIISGGIPGYGGGGVGHVFDWTLNLGVRYTF